MVFGKGGYLAIADRDGILYLSVHKETVGHIGTGIVACVENAVAVIKAVTRDALQSIAVDLHAALHMLIRIAQVIGFSHVTVLICLARHGFCATFAVKGTSEQGKAFRIVFLHSRRVARQGGENQEGLAHTSATDLRLVFGYVKRAAGCGRIVCNRAVDNGNEVIAVILIPDTASVLGCTIARDHTAVQYAFGVRKRNASAVSGLVIENVTVLHMERSAPHVDTAALGQRVGIEILKAVSADLAAFQGNGRLICPYRAAVTRYVAGKLAVFHIKKDIARAGKIYRAAIAACVGVQRTVLKRDGQTVTYAVGRRINAVDRAAVCHTVTRKITVYKGCIDTAGEKYRRADLGRCHDLFPRKVGFVDVIHTREGDVFKTDMYGVLLGRAAHHGKRAARKDSRRILTAFNGHALRKCHPHRGVGKFDITDKDRIALTCIMKCLLQL